MPFSDWNVSSRSYLVDTSGKIIGANKAAKKKFQSFGDDINGKYIREVVPKDRADRHMKIFQEIALTKKASDFIETNESTKKHYRIIPLFDDDGEVVEFLSLVSNVTIPRRDILWERLIYAWGNAKPIAKLCTLTGLWFVGAVSKPMFYWRSLTIAVIFLVLTYVNAFSQIHFVEIFSAMIAGGTLALLICGTILRYFIR